MIMSYVRLQGYNLLGGLTEMYNSYLVGKNVRRCRLGNKYTIDKLAELLNISRSHLTQIELGTRNMSIKLLSDIAICLKTDANTLLGLDEKEFPIETALNDLPYEKAAELKMIFMEMIELANIID